MRDLGSGDTRIYLEFEVRRIRCRTCNAVKREKLDFLADKPFYTKRFAWFVGRRCRTSGLTDVAKELGLGWRTVKELDKQYMQIQLERAGTPDPKAIGIDEMSIKKGHTYRIVVSDLIGKRPIWFGGADRSEASMLEFYDWLGPKTIYRKVDDLDGTAKVGSKQCVALVQHYAHAPSTTTWTEGKAVMGDAIIAKGTVIATFKGGKYESHTTGNHAAFFLSKDAGGIWVMDQWANDEVKPMVSKRYLRRKGTDGNKRFVDPGNNADAYSVVE